MSIAGLWAQRVEEGPDPAVHGVVRWRLKDLAAWLAEEAWPHARRDHGRSRSEGARLSQAVGPSAPSRARRTGRFSDFKKSFPTAVAAVRAKLLSGTVIEIWWQDEARIGQKKRHHPALGETRHPAFGAAGSAHRIRPICSGRSARKPARAAGPRAAALHDPPR